ncbi:MAG: chromate transporter [Firmicutes bacterium]|nr:chromate transporter [Bacillota bacterium]
MSENKGRLKDNMYFQLFVEFFTLGLFTFGGGPAMIGLLEERMSRRGWLDSDEVLDCIAVAQTLPGVIAVNMSIYVGYRLKGFKGALISVFGMVLPSFVIIILIAMFMDNFGTEPHIQGALKGIRAATCGLILATAVKLAKQTYGRVKGSRADSLFSVLMFGASFLLISVIGIDAVWVILSGLILGICYSLLKARRAGA